MTNTPFLRQELQRRPWWMNILFVWCVILAIGVPYELLSRPVAEDIEVWFGFELTARKLPAPSTLIPTKVSTSWLLFGSLRASYHTVVTTPFC